MAKSKQKIEKIVQLKKRKHNEEQRKMDHAMESSTTAEQKKDSEGSASSNADEEDADFHLPETSNKRKKQLQEKRPAVSLNLDPNQWNKTVSLGDKHHISHRGLTEVMSAAVSSGGGNINDLFFLKT